MKTAVFLTLLATTAIASAQELATRSTSSSKQFVAYCDDVKLRTDTLSRAEELKREFLDLLRAKDDWKMPIILKFAPPPNAKRPPKFNLGIYEGDDGSNKIQIDIYDPKLARDPAMNTQILSALVLEYTYRNTPVKAGRSFAKPPAWFVEGLAAKIRSRDQGVPANVYSSLLAGGRSPKLADFLDTRPERLDTTSLALYSAQAAALLEALIALPDGRPGLKAYLSAPRRGTDANEIVMCFPSLAKNREALSRKWLLAVARGSAADRGNIMTERETAKELDTVLAVKPLPDPKRPEVAAMSGPYALPTIARSQNGKFILAQIESSLMRISVRAHPLYKSLTEEYLRIVQELERKPKRKLHKRIAAAEETRAALTRETGDARDYVDWVETTKVKTQSEEIQHTLDDLEEMDQPPARTDAISRYLDAAEERN